ncbi:MAG: primosomal protein N' [Clostridiales bacterium]|nr:primosomal protein N' [Clostridiales bacterium]
MPLIAKVAVENTAFSFDMLFDYLIPEDLANDVRPGCRVLVDFGRGGKNRQGVVFYITDEIPDGGKKLKAIIKNLDKEPVLDDEMIKLAEFISDRTFCTLFNAVKVMLPPGFYLKIIETFRTVPSKTDRDFEELNDTERQVVEYLRKKDSFVSAEKINKALGLSGDAKIPEELSKKGFLLKNTDTGRRINDASVKIVSINPEYAEKDSIPVKLTSKQSAVIDLLREIGSAASKEVAYYTGVTQAVIENLYKKGYVFYSDAEIYRTPKERRSAVSDKSPIILTEMQNNAYNTLRGMRDSEQAEAALLFGVTGSGKTKIYMKLIDDIADTDKGVIVLVPEISLTPQMLNMFYARYGEKVAALHSGLSLGERLDEWKRINRGEANIVVGTRSASFAPVKNLAMIIIDEEQESTYKSEMTPRYRAQDIARFRCAYNKALLVLGSATPSVETYANALNGRYKLIELTERYSKYGLPEVKTVDTSLKENMNGMQTVSTVLADELRLNLENKQQSILLINRRGFNTFAACTKCKSVITCPHCSISMTYHSVNDRLMCHYCGYSEPVQTKCPFCGSDTMRFSGFGTQKAEQELNILFPDARILRMDADTTAMKYSHNEKFSAFANGDYDIMIGTQMVAKGLDFPNVTLVGVISVDQQLYNDDFKSTERAFDLLTQVVGRSGRGEKCGRAVIQTMAPENAVIELAAAQNYRDFYDTEIKIRKGMTYPPYCDLCVIGLSGTGEINVKNAAREFFRLFKDRLKNDYADEKVMVLGPAPPKISKISNHYRERLIIKCKNSARFRYFIAQCLKEFSSNKAYNKIAVYADMNPESLY